MQRLLNIPSKTDDYTSVLQAISKIISEKLNASVIQEAISKNSTAKSKDVIFISYDGIFLFINMYKVLNSSKKIKFY
jgi:hypothetical protein